MKGGTEHEAWTPFVPILQSVFSPRRLGWMRVRDETRRYETTKEPKADETTKEPKADETTKLHGGRFR